MIKVNLTTVLSRVAVRFNAMEQQPSVDNNVDEDPLSSDEELVSEILNREAYRQQHGPWTDEELRQVGRERREIGRQQLLILEERREREYEEMRRELDDERFRLWLEEQAALDERDEARHRAEMDALGADIRSDIIGERGEDEKEEGGGADDQEVGNEEDNEDRDEDNEEKGEWDEKVENREHDDEGGAKDDDDEEDADNEGVGDEGDDEDQDEDNGRESADGKEVEDEENDNGDGDSI